MVKDTGSQFFDSAYFVIKSDLPPSARDSDMLAEAHRMIDACVPEAKPHEPVGTPHVKLRSKRHIGAWIVITAAMLSVIGTAAAVIIMQFS